MTRARTVDVPRHRYVARGADDRMRVCGLPVRRSAGSAIASVGPARPATALGAHRHVDRPARAGAPLPASPASTRSSSRTATPITSWGSTMSGGSTSCSRKRSPVTPATTPCTELRRTFSYIFDADHRQGRRRAAHRAAHAGRSVLPGSVHEVTPVPIWHGKRRIYGYRIGGLAYLTDCSAIPDGIVAAARGAGLSRARRAARPAAPHAFLLDQALAAVERIRPTRALFTHIAHDLPHAATCARLPAGVELAYDGLTLQFAL